MPDTAPVVLVGMSAREVQAAEQLRELAAPHDGDRGVPPAR